MKHIKIVESSFEKFGKFVYDNKWKLVIVSFLLNGIFGLGLLSLTLNNDIKSLFVNEHTEAKKLEEKLLTMYPDKSREQFKVYSSIKLPLFVDVIVSAKSKENLFDPFFINQTHKLIDGIKNVSIMSDYLGLINYTDLCARNSGSCVMEGSEILQELGQCKNKSSCLNINNLNSSFSTEIFSSILNSIGEYTLNNGTFVSARYIKFRLYLRQDTKGVSRDSKHWQNNFIRYMSSFKSAYLDVAFSHSTSIFEEIGQDTYPDIRFFALTFTILMIYLGVYISGGDCVSKRMNIGRMGTIVVPLSILGAWGLVTGAGLEFTNCVGVMPYFALCKCFNLHFSYQMYDTCNVFNTVSKCKFPNQQASRSITI